jgi:hypothetical protein
MASTLKCNKCGEMYRTSSPYEFHHHRKHHKKICNGEFESIWKNYINMTDEEKEIMIKAVTFRQGIITESKKGVEK